MGSIFVLIKREILIFTKNISSYLFFVFTYPIILYLFLITPFHNLLQPSSGMNYLYHGIPAILFLCTLTISFAFPLIIAQRDRYQSDYFYFLLSFNINVYNYSIYIILISLLFSYIQFTISLFLLIQLSQNIIISWEELFYFIIIIFPSSLLFILLGLTFSNFIKNTYSMIISFIFLFSFLTFGIGSFIPIEYFSDNYKYVTESYNLVFHLYDMFIKVFQSENIHLGIPVSAIFISVLLYVLNVLIISKKMSKY